MSDTQTKSALLRKHARTARTLNMLIASLSEREAHFRGLFESMQEGFIIYELIYNDAHEPIDYVILEMNPAAVKLTQLDPADILSRSMVDYYREHYGTDEPIWLSTFATIAGDGQPISQEYYHPLFHRYFNVSLYSPHPGQVAVIFADIQERKEAETALRESERSEQEFYAALRALLEVQTRLLSEHDTNALFQRAIELGQSVLDFDRISLWLPTDDPTILAGTYGVGEDGQLRDERHLRRLINRESLDEAILSNTTRLIVREHSPLCNARSEPIGEGTLAVAALWDGTSVAGLLYTDNLISQRPFTRHHAELLELYAAFLGHRYIELRAEQQIGVYQEELRALAMELIVTEEHNRRELAQALHDSVSQTLALARLQLSTLDTADATQRGEIGNITALLDRTLQDVRMLTFELSPPILHELGLDAAIEWLAETIQQQHHLPVIVRCSRWQEHLSDDLRAFLFMAIRETLLNVVKHARAHRAMVWLKKEQGVIHVEVRDDGCGFDLDQLRTPAGEIRGFGLFSIRERLRHLGGQLAIDSAPGKGTRVAFQLPYPPVK